jgi:hypothetical protein
VKLGTVSNDHLLIDSRWFVHLAAAVVPAGRDGMTTGWKFLSFMSSYKTRHKKLQVVNRGRKGRYARLPKNAPS